jgi:RimJ/RimL family protein N-acetyltransferase
MAHEPHTMPPFAELTVDTERLRLRPLVDSDDDALFAIFSDPEVTRYLSHPPWTSMDAARELIDRDRRSLPANEYVRLGLVRRSDDRLIGVCSLFSFHLQSRRSEIGYTLAADAWGQGFMREALVAVIDLAFGELGLNRLEADIDPRNAPSARILERLGFRKEGYLRERWIVAGEVTDTELYGLLARDWGRRSEP